MLEIKRIIETYDRIKTEPIKLALATVVHVEDSSYRRSGARMLIQSNGTWTGGISGGCLEGDTLIKAQNAIHQNKTITVRYDTREEDPNQIGVGLGCNGLIDVLITPINNDDLNNPIEVLRSSLLTRDAHVFLTFVKCPNDVNHDGAIIHYKDKHSIEGNAQLEHIASTLLADIAIVKDLKASLNAHYNNGQSGWNIFIEYLPPTIRLLIFGSNYDTIPLANIARSIGWDTIMITNPKKLLRQQYESVDRVIATDQELPSMDNYTAAILMSHDFKTDKKQLAQLITLDLPYIGLLGPKKRSDKMFQELNLTDASSLDYVFAPVGLDTGATSPEEIAISIIAEIRTCLSGRRGGYLRERGGSIH